MTGGGGTEDVQEGQVNIGEPSSSVGNSLPPSNPEENLAEPVASSSSGNKTSDGKAENSNEAGPAQNALNNAGNQGASVSVEGNGSWLQYSDLMSDSYPAKSKFVYLKAYRDFEKFLKSRNQWLPNTVPSDLHVLNYFHHLRHELKYAPTTLWSLYARINAVMKRVFGVSLNSYSRVGDVLKSYDSGHIVKKAGVFTPQQIEDFVSDPALSSKYWLVRKVVCLVGYYGGFRNKELKSLKFENCECDSMGYWFEFNRAKQRGRLEPTSICVPRRQPDWVPVVSDSSRVGLDFDPASLIDLYLEEVQADLLCSREELKGDFFRATHGEKGQKFTKLSLGKNTLGRVGVQVATELCLPRPEIYTGHCWRRSCGTSASDSGVNVTTLMAMMGWSNPKTAMVYVKKSRMTSLSLSLYLTNVQRQNCPNPFPNSPLEKRQAVRKIADSSSVVAKSSNSLVSPCNSKVSSESGISDFKLESSDVVECSQESKFQDMFPNSEEVEEIDFDACDSRKEDEEVVRQSVVSGERAEGRGDGRLEGGTVMNVSASNLVADQISNIDPRLAGFLHNLQNSGNVTINFHFDRK